MARRAGRLRAWLARLAIAGALASGAPVAAQTGDWVATWTASEEPPLAADPQNTGFADQTVRMVVRTSAAGEAARVRISNAYGTRPLVIGSAHTALSAGASAIVPGSDRTLTFGGAASVVIQPGATIVSDAAPLHAPAISHLAVSLYLPRLNEPATYHHVCLCDTYVVSGNGADRLSLPAQDPRHHWFYLADVEVRPAGGADLIVALGDSITDGFRSMPDRAWPNILADRLAERALPLAVVDEGLTGNGLLHTFEGPNGPSGGPSALARFDRDVLNLPGAKYVIALIGVNDIGHSESAGTPASARAIVEGYRQLVARAHARGLIIFGGTLTPIGGPLYDTPAHQAMREAVNRAIRNEAIFDGVIDFDAAVRDPLQPGQMRAAFATSDGLHPNAAGDLAMAQGVDLSLFGAARAHGAIDPNGRPLSVPSDKDRYEVWHDQNGWRVAADAAAGGMARFTGSVVARTGRFDNVALPMRFPIPGLPRPSFEVSPDGAMIQFDAVVAGDRMPMVLNFAVTGEKPTLEFSLRSGPWQSPALGDCGPRPTCASSEPRTVAPGDVYIGQAGAHPASVPFDLLAHGDASGDPSAARAKAAWDALVNNLAAPGRPGLYFEAPGRTNVVAVWGHSQILHAALDMAMLTHDSADFEHALSALNLYMLNGAYAPTIHPGSGETRFWDDNGWVLLALEQAMVQFPDSQRFEQMVEPVFSSFIASGQAAGGGIYWKERDPDPDRGIPATGSNIEVALRLHLATAAPGQASKALKFANFNDAWVENTLHSPDGWYWNAWFDGRASRACHPSPTPPPPLNVCERFHSYNQGTMIGADVLYARIWPDRGRLDHAAATAQAALDFLTPERLWAEPPAFNAIFFRNLMALDHFRPNPRYRAVLAGYLERVWTEARDPATGLFTKGGLGHYGDSFGSLDQAAIVQMFALLAWPRERTGDLS